MPSSTLRTPLSHGHLLSGAQKMKGCQSLSFKRKTNDHIWYHTWFPWDILLFPSAKPNKTMYYILFHVISTIRPWQWWLILLQWNLYVFNQKLFYVDSSLHSGFKWYRTHIHYAEITLVERRMKLGTQPFPKAFRVYPRHILRHAQIPHVFLISQKRPDSAFNYHKPVPHVYITVKSP